MLRTLPPSPVHQSSRARASRSTVCCFWQSSFPQCYTGAVQVCAGGNMHLCVTKDTLQAGVRVHPPRASYADVCAARPGHGQVFILLRPASASPTRTCSSCHQPKSEKETADMNSRHRNGNRHKTFREFVPNPISSTVLFLSSISMHNSKATH